jgi:hypothetical protein
MIGLRIAQAEHEHPVLTSLAFAVVEAPVLAGFFALISSRPTLTSYLVDTVVMTIAVAGGLFVGRGRVRKMFPPGLSAPEAREVRRIVWLGLPVQDREQALAVISYSQTILKAPVGYFAIPIVCGGLVAGIGFLLPPDLPPVRHTVAFILVEAVAVLVLLMLPYTLRTRRRARTAQQHAIALRSSAQVT